MVKAGEIGMIKKKSRSLFWRHMIMGMGCTALLLLGLFALYPEKIAEAAAAGYYWRYVLWPIGIGVGLGWIAEYVVLFRRQREIFDGEGNRKKCMGMSLLRGLIILVFFGFLAFLV